jgi:secreted trypsin-like serine protease
MLKEVDIEISNQDLCHDLYDGLGFKLLPGQICAALNGANIGVCRVNETNEITEWSFDKWNNIFQGDSGGPLLVDGVQVGVPSWNGDGCASPVYPTIFTRVAYYRDWITLQIGI